MLRGVARYLPGRWAPGLPFHRYFLVATSAIVFLVVVAGALPRPRSVVRPAPDAPNFHIAIGWTYGGLVAIGAALISLAIVVVSLQSDGI